MRSIHLSDLSIHDELKLMRRLQELFGFELSERMQLSF